MIDLRGTLVGQLALMVTQLINTEADRVHRAHRDLAGTTGEPATTTRANHMAEAFGNLCRQGAATDLTSTRPPEPEAVVVLHDTHPDQPTTLDGHRLPPSLIALFACAAVLRPIVIDRHGNPLWAGHTIPLANRHQRRALAIRDGGCVFPGCGCPVSWTDAHHVRHRRRDHGPTDIDNLALLCRFHHGMTHRKGWAMHATGDQWFWWETPNGNTFWSQRHGQPRAGPIPLAM